MKLSEILSIAGQPGLYKYVAQGKGGIIVESLTEDKRMLVSGSAKVSSLGDIAIYTESGDIALSEVLKTMMDKYEQKETISHKSSTIELLKTMSEIVPDFDKDRVHASDMKKLIMWYNILASEGITSFEVESESEADTEAAE